jgi:Flp pilus assembly protein TadB
MSRQSSLRASDADRDAIAARLHKAAVEGRLEADELEQRLHAALRARTYGELGRLVADLPAPRERRRSSGSLVLTLALRLAVLLAVVVVAVVVIAFTATSWLVFALLWLVLRGRHGPGRCGMRHRPPRMVAR